MHNRRHFIRKTGALALGSLILTRHGYASFFNSAASHPVGLQLFTLFNTIDKDVPGTLKQIAQVGYLEIESAFSMKGGFYGICLACEGFGTCLGLSPCRWSSIQNASRWIQNARKRYQQTRTTPTPAEISADEKPERKSSGNHR
jgi:hypothetical protein